MRELYYLLTLERSYDYIIVHVAYYSTNYSYALIEF